MIETSFESNGSILSFGFFSVLFMYCELDCLSLLLSSEILTEPREPLSLLRARLEFSVKLFLPLY